MISRLRGVLASVRPDRVEVATDAGVTYEVRVPAGAYGVMGEPGRPVELFTALVAREDALELFGFGSSRDRELFLRLQNASGVGPRLALAILGTLSARRIVSAIRNREHAALEMVSGIGRKTAERIALELGDKLDDLPEADEEEAPLADGAVEVLRALGYSRAESERALAEARRVLSDGGEPDEEALVRAALRHL